MADTTEPGTAEFSWDWSLTRTRATVGLACFQTATRALCSYLGWEPPELDAWEEHLAAFVRDSNQLPPQRDDR